MMKKFVISAIAAAATLALVFSCNREELPTQEDQQTPSRAVTISATLTDLTTKVALDPIFDATYGKPQEMVLTWAEGDKLRIYNHADRSKYSDFELSAESIGKKKGDFTGSLVSATSYDVEIINGDFDYALQAQPSDGVTTGLKYLASVSGITDCSTITFDSFSSVLAITAQMPSSAVAAKIKSVDITASEDIFDSGNAITVTLAKIGDADNDGVLHLFATLPQGNVAVPAGTTLLVKLNAPGEEHDVYTRFITLGARTFTNNTVNAININATNSASYANASTDAIGTSTNPYLIGDKYQMLAMHDLVADNAVTHFKMVDDVDLEGIAWISLNHEGEYSKGIDFDGAGHTIDHLSSNGTDCDYPSFAGVLKGSVRNVTFDHATITCGDNKKGGVVGGYIGKKNAFTGNCSNVSISNATLSSTAACGVLGGQGDNLGTITECYISNSSITGKARLGGLIGSVVVFNEISDCSVENVTISSDSYYNGGLVGQLDGGGTILRCHTSGTISSSYKYSRTGGLIGYVINGDVRNSYSSANVNATGQFGGALIGQVKNGSVAECYATGTVTAGNHYLGGIVGLVEANGQATIDKCYYDGTLSAPGKRRAGGIVSLLGTSSTTTISNCYSAGSWTGTAWFGGIVGSAGEDADKLPTSLTVTNCYTVAEIEGSQPGALIGADFMPAETVHCSGFIAWWASGNLKGTGEVEVTPSSYYIGQEYTVSVKGIEFGWSNDIWDFSTDEPKIKWNGVVPGGEEPDDVPDDPNWSDTPTITLSGATTVTIRPGVEYTHFHGQWEGQWREINILKTTLNEHNSLGVYYDYGDTYGFLDQKCVYLNALGGTNGSMACCQFVRVDTETKHAATDTESEYWISNCALTIDDDNAVNIVKVKDNYAAARLKNKTVSCAGPLLVWKGQIQSYPEETSADFLKTTHPRTAIGLSKDGKTVIQVAVDGRWTSSNTAKRAIGMSTPLLSKLMKGLGCYKAMNFDGGGGTAMWVYGQGIDGIVNHPHNDPYSWSTPTLRKCGSAVYIKSDLK